jgi:hypothetical protein
MKNQAIATKDRTSLFIGRPEFIITPKTGQMILQWCNEGVSDELTELKQRINDCKTIEELFKLYHANPRDEKTKALFTARRIEFGAQVTKLSNSKTDTTNGTDDNNNNR